MTFPLLSIVQMKGERFRAEGVEPRAIGVVVEVYGDDQYEVEFSDHAGITIALLTIGRDDLELIAESASSFPSRSDA